MKQDDLQPGDHIERPGRGIGYTHHGVFLGPGPDGMPVVIHATKFKLVELVPFETFADGRDVTRRFRPDSSELPNVFYRAFSSLGKPYNLWNANCEHFARWITTGRHESLQKGSVIFTVATVAAFSWALAAKSKRDAAEWAEAYDDED